MAGGDAAPGKTPMARRAGLPSAGDGAPIPMEQILQRLAEHAFMAAVPPTLLLLGCMLFRRRVKREQSADYQRPSPGGGIRRG